MADAVGRVHGGHWGGSLCDEAYTGHAGVVVCHALLHAGSGSTRSTGSAGSNTTAPPPVVHMLVSNILGRTVNTTILFRVGPGEALEVARADAQQGARLATQAVDAETVAIRFVDLPPMSTTLFTIKKSGPDSVPKAAATRAADDARGAGDYSHIDDQKDKRSSSSNSTVTTNSSIPTANATATAASATINNSSDHVGGVAADLVLSNEHVQLSFNAATGMLESITDVARGVRTAVAIQLGW